ncbi:hypothetical protein [Dactylosporangium sp. CA-139066]|uniref:hypothetical protein n=1 Tax=Dactylosporangium sp. CA-139066 TaxID=3239930 RepID=UPI003D927801
MLVRRLMTVMALSVMAGLSAACGADDDLDAGKGVAASAAATASAAGGDGKAGTEEVCKTVVDIFTREKLNLAEVMLALATANMDGTQAEKDKAKADAEALLARLNPEVGAAAAKAADPKLKAALDGFMATISKLLTLEAVADPDFEQKFTAASDEATKYCPALKDA